MSYFETSSPIFTGSDALDHTSYRPEYFVDGHDGLHELSKHLSPALQGRKPTNIYLHGNSGTGKTATTTHLLKTLEDEFQATDTPFTWQHVDASATRTPNQTLFAFVNKLRRDRDREQYATTGYPYGKAKEFLRTELHLRGGVSYLVIDEADQLTNPTKLLRPLADLAEANDLGETKIGLILIANNGEFIETLDVATRSRLQEVQIPMTSYHPDEVASILEARAAEAFHDGVLPEDQLQHCAAITQSMSGDIRDGFRLLDQAGQIAETRIRESTRSNDFIRDADVSAARAELRPHWITGTVEKLESRHRHLLDCVCGLEDKGDLPVKTKRLHSMHSELFELSFCKKTIRSALQRLEQQGLIASTVENNGRASNEGGRFLLWSVTAPVDAIQRAVRENGDNNCTDGE